MQLVATKGSRIGHRDPHPCVRGPHRLAASYHSAFGVTACGYPKKEGGAGESLSTSSSVAPPVLTIMLNFCPARIGDRVTLGISARGPFRDARTSQMKNNFLPSMFTEAISIRFHPLPAQSLEIRPCINVHLNQSQR